MSYQFKEHLLNGYIACGDAFWEGLEDGVLRLCRCASCHEWLWHTFYGGVDIRCGTCGCWDIEWVAVEPEATVYAWIRTNQNVPLGDDFWDEVPYITVEAEFFGPNGPRLLGRLKGSAEGLRPGATVRAEIDRPSDKTYGYPSIRWVLTDTATAR